MRRVLVTGGAGFIGSHVVDALMASEVEVVVLDALDPGTHADLPPYLNPAAELAIGDVRNADAVERALRGVDAVCHQASMVGLGVDLADLPAYVSHNDLGTAVLLAAMHRNGFRGRLVLASSMVVYGEGWYRCEEHGTIRPRPRRREDLEAGRFEPRCEECGRALLPEPIPEHAPLEPRNVYAATKVHQEHLCSVFARESGNPVTALRYHNVYGPRMPRETPYAGVASVFRSALETGRRPRVFEDGGQLRDFVHVCDVARANVLALLAEEPVSGAFNVASGDPRSVGEMASTLAEEFGAGRPPLTTGGFRLGDVRHVFASPTLARERLGFAAEVGFDEGVRGFATAPLRGTACGRAGSVGQSPARTPVARSPSTSAAAASR